MNGVTAKGSSVALGSKFSLTTAELALGSKLAQVVNLIKFSYAKSGSNSPNQLARYGHNRLFLSRSWIKGLKKSFQLAIFGDGSPSHLIENMSDTIITLSSNVSLANRIAALIAPRESIPCRRIAAAHC